MAIFVYSFLYLSVNIVKEIENFGQEKEIKIGVLGEISNSHPLYVKTLPEKIASNLVNCSLVKFDPYKFSYIPQVAYGFNFSPDIKTLTIYLNKSYRWQDGNYVKIDDIDKFLNLIKFDEKIIHPIKINFQGVNLRKKDEKIFEFVLSKPYYPFIYNLTFPIFTDTEKNKIKFCGAYFIEKISDKGKFKIIYFKKNFYYPLYDNLFYSRIKLYAFSDEDYLISYFKKGKIDLIISPFYKDEFFKLKYFFYKKIYRVKNPTNYLIGFNLNNEKFKDKKTRKYLSNIINKDLLLTNSIKGYGEVLYGAFNEEFFGIEKLKKENTQFFSKPNLKEFKLTFFKNKFLEKLAKFIKKQFESRGIKIILDPIENKEKFFETLSEKNFEAILLGQSYIYPPDPFSFWSSSQVVFPGQNITGFEDEKVDELIEKIRQEKFSETSKKYLEQLNKILYEKSPAVFLISPDYIVISRKNINFPQNLKANYPEEIINLFSLPLWRNW